MIDEIAITQSESTVPPRIGPVEPNENGRTGYGLPCIRCKIYYSAGLEACPVCKCSERVSPNLVFRGAVVRL
jgi:hypothetical protein